MKQELKNEMFDAMLRSAFQDYAKAAKPQSRSWKPGKSSGPGASSSMYFPRSLKGK